MYLLAGYSMHSPPALSYVSGRIHIIQVGEIESWARSLALRPRWFYWRTSLWRTRTTTTTITALTTITTRGIIDPRL
jgi:hypothetical protein